MTAITVTTVGYREVHDCRVPGRSSRCCCCSAASARRSTPSRCSRRSSSRAACRSGSSGAGTPACSNTITDHFIICGYGRIGSIVAGAVAAARRCPFVVIERDADRLQAAMDDGALGGRGRREPRGRAEARRHRARARADRRGRHRRRERLRRAERARAAARPLHRRPRRDRGRDERS